MVHRKIHITWTAFQDAGLLKMQKRHDIPLFHEIGLANGRFRDRMGPAKGNSLLRSKEVFLANGRFRERMRLAKGILLAKF